MTIYIRMAEPLKSYCLCQMVKLGETSARLEGHMVLWCNWIFRTRAKRKKRLVNQQFLAKVTICQDKIFVWQSF